jgi:hypothetical protein
VKPRTAVPLLAALVLGGAAAAPQGRGGKPETAPAAAEAPAPPIEWLPWSAAVFERARKEDRGVLLNVVSRWCRPCQAADQGVFADETVRRLVAARWIPVRVDREERPDVDTRYQIAAAPFTKGKGGWPLNVFLLPTGEAMWAELTLPPEDQMSGPGMRTLLARLDHWWRNLLQDARKNALRAMKTFEDEKRPRRPAPLAPELLSAVVDGVVAAADYDHGGYGAVPRYANPYAVELVLLAAGRRSDSGLREQALGALRGPVRGGLFDRLGGGFHRAARDPGWGAPYFDKPLVVNAAYLKALVEAVRVAGDEELRSAAGRTVDYILGTLAAPGGGFHVSQGPSADPDDDAAYYAWRVEEAASLFGEEDLGFARRLLGFGDEGEILLGLPARFVLKQPLTIEEAARAAGVGAGAAEKAATRVLRRLSESRAGRPVPPVAPVQLLDATSLAASALLHAGAVLGRADATAAALRALDAILGAHPDPGRGLPHRLAPSAGAESPVLMADLAYLGLALVDAHEATGEARYLEAASRCASAIQSLFQDREAGGFHDVLAAEDAQGYVRIRRKVIADYVAPSPQASAARLLIGLARRTGDEKFLGGVEGALSWTASHLLALDERAAGLGAALDLHLHPPLRITVPRGASGARDLASAALRLAAPGRIVIWRDGGAGEAAARVCLGDACREGARDAAAIAAAVEDLTSGRGGGRVGSVAAPGSLW